MKIKYGGLVLFFCLLLLSPAYAANSKPALVVISPPSGSFSSNQKYTFTTVFSDLDGFKDIRSAGILITPSQGSGGAGSFYASYDQRTNKLSLKDGKDSYAPKSSNILENSYGALDCSKTTISGNGKRLSISWSVTFKDSFLGKKDIRIYVQDPASYLNWARKEVYTIKTGALPAPNGTIKINDGLVYTKSSAVTLGLTTTYKGSGLQVRFSNDKNIWSAAEPYTPKRENWPLSAGEGEKKVYVEFSAAPGSWSEPAWDSIILDTHSPVITINPIKSPTNQDVTLSYKVEDNFTPYQDIVVTGDQSPYRSPDAEERKYNNIILIATDGAGNSTTKAVPAFTIDKKPPEVVITFPQDGEYVDTREVTVEGTIDNIPFKEEKRPLTTEGVNQLTKEAPDASGNIGISQPVTVYYSPPKLIKRNQGGVVYSPDNAVRLDIPKDALLDDNGQIVESAWISILPKKKDKLQYAPSKEDATLVSVFECKPYGLRFNPEATITYTLPQAEVPGTPVQFGFYQAQPGKDGKTQYIIKKDSPISYVAKDGYTLTFPIEHFSSYAGLQIAPPTGPIGLGIKIPLPDMLTGAVSHSIPLTIPPGRRGVQPALAFNYRSSNSNSWVGVGFSFNPGYIVRSSRLGPPVYDDANGDTKDTFYLVTDAGTTELVHLVDNLYQAKIESSFAKFFKETDGSWRVVNKDGSVLRFGQTPESKEGSSKGTFSWFLTRTVDTNGNYVAYCYAQDQGKSYLSRIDYTGNESVNFNPTNTVEFFLEPREDISSSYITSNKIATTKRLSEIQIKVDSDLVWRYVLEYYPYDATDTNRSLLKSVTQKTSDGKSFPAQTFIYQTSN